MTLSEIKLLIKNGVKLEFVVDPAILVSGFYVSVRKSGDLGYEFEPIATARDPKNPRLFKNLSVVYGLITEKFHSDFRVACPN